MWCFGLTQGNTIEYGNTDNMTRYYNGATLTWRNGRELASYSLGQATYIYAYSVNGLRTRKINAADGYALHDIIDVEERRR